MLLRPNGIQRANKSTCAAWLLEAVSKVQKILTNEYTRQI